jgi:S-(hydroxymethyl)glutathione dehydrogenase/alcohol dehydrogenase
VSAVRNTARVRPGSRVAVFGCGGVGLNAVQGARLAGATRIVAIDLTEEKLDLARRFGATDVVHAGQEDPAGAIHRLMDGVDYAFEGAGREQTVQQAWLSLTWRRAAVVGPCPIGPQ